MTTSASKLAGGLPFINTTASPVLTDDIETDRHIKRSNVWIEADREIGTAVRRFVDEHRTDPLSTAPRPDRDRLDLRPPKHQRAESSVLLAE